MMFCCNNGCVSLSTKQRGSSSTAKVVEVLEDPLESDSLVFSDSLTKSAETRLSDQPAELPVEFGRSLRAFPALPAIAELDEILEEQKSEVEGDEFLEGQNGHAGPASGEGLNDDAGQASLEKPGTAKPSSDQKLLSIIEAQLGGLVTHRYKIELNAYGLMVYVLAYKTRRHVVCTSCLLLIMHYLLAFGCTASISLGVVTAFRDVQHPTELCTKDKGYIDCTPVGFDNLFNFDALDTNADGIWTVREARDAGLLREFRNLHDVALEQPDLISALLPPSDPVPDLFCYSLMYSFDSTSMWSRLSLSDLEILIRESGRLTADAELSCGAPKTRDEYHCLFRSICASMTLIPRLGSRERYLQTTHHMNTVPHWLHDAFVQNLLRPCRLLDPEACGNAEVHGAAILRNVTMWAGLNPNERVVRCQWSIQNICPRLFGSHYSRFQNEFKETCGKRSRQMVNVPHHLPGNVSADASGKACADNDAALREAWGRLEQVHGVGHIMTASSRVIEIKFGLPRGSWLRVASCSNIGNAFCDNPFQIPTGAHSSTSISAFVGSHCPSACCSIAGLGCPSQCSSRQASVTTVTLPFGEPDISSESLRIERKGPFKSETAKIIIAANSSLRAYILKMHLFDSSSLASDACLVSRLSINGEHYCNANGPLYTKIPQRNGVAELHWLSREACSDDACGWELMLVDAGEAATYAIPEVSYELQEVYNDRTLGIVGYPYRTFLIFVAIIWLAYNTTELLQALDLLWFALWCPFQGLTKRSRALLLLFVVMPRMLLLVCVLIVGVALFMVSTSFIEIVLNSVALAFIIEIDEGIYKTVAPKSIQDQVEAVDEHEWQQNAGHFLGCCFEHSVPRTCLTLAPLVGAVIYQYTREHGFDAISEISSCLCGMSGPRCYNAVFDV